MESLSFVWLFLKLVQCMWMSPRGWLESLPQLWLVNGPVGTSPLLLLWRRDAGGLEGLSYLRFGLRCIEWIISDDNDDPDLSEYPHGYEFRYGGALSNGSVDDYDDHHHHQESSEAAQVRLSLGQRPHVCLHRL
mmetsp:Transcript_7240/g.23176  ORF Transcript_7240/g.23176 Transcript_7240/m.23176 type:complete len:134 (-) Transcript_7240:348-749(-)